MQLTIEQQVGTAWVYSYASILKNNTPNFLNLGNETDIQSQESETSQNHDPKEVHSKTHHN